MGRGSWAVTPLRQAEGAQVGILLIVESPKDEALLSRFRQPSIITNYSSECGQPTSASWISEVIMRVWHMFPVLYLLCTVMMVFEATVAWAAVFMAFQWLFITLWTAVILYKKELRRWPGITRLLYGC